jgi:hypothetical protein
MPLPGYAAAASLYTTSRSYPSIRSGPMSHAAPTVVAQHDPCALPGGGGGGSGPPPGPCPRGRKCCGIIQNGRCSEPCIPDNAQCQ